MQDFACDTDYTSNTDYSRQIWDGGNILHSSSEDNQSSEVFFIIIIIFLNGSSHLVKILCVDFLLNLHFLHRQTAKYSVKREINLIFICTYWIKKAPVPG